MSLARRNHVVQIRVQFVLKLSLELLNALPQILEKTLCRADLLPTITFARLECNPAVAAGAKLSAMNLIDAHSESSL